MMIKANAIKFVSRERSNIQDKSVKFTVKASTINLAGDSSICSIKFIFYMPVSG